MFSTTTSITSSTDCELSLSGAAFSSALSAFIGSILNGLFSGYWVAFVTGWISGLAFMRIIAAGLYEFYLAFKAGSRFEDFDTNTQYATIGFPMEAYPATTTTTITATDDAQTTTTTTAAAATAADEEQGTNPPSQTLYGYPIDNETAAKIANLTPSQKKTLKRFFGKGPPVRTVTTFGWLGWIWSGVYTPISQSMWLSVNISSGRGAALLVRALAIAVSALGLTFDYKQRYAASVGRKWGSWAFITFNIWNASACLLLGIEALILLITAMVNLSHDMPREVIIALPILYTVLSIIWAAVSWAIIPPIDAARPGIHIVIDVLMGAFAGIILAAPAFALSQSNFGEETGMSLGEYLNCEGTSLVNKFAAVMP